MCSNFRKENFSKVHFPSDNLSSVMVCIVNTYDEKQGLLDLNFTCVHLGMLISGSAILSFLPIRIRESTILYLIFPLEILPRMIEFTFNTIQLKFNLFNTMKFLFSLLWLYTGNVLECSFHFTQEFLCTFLHTLFIGAIKDL